MDLYITTATEGLSAEELELQPQAGLVFIKRVDVNGRDATPFGGRSIG